MEAEAEEKQAVKLAAAEGEGNPQAAAGLPTITTKQGATQPAASDDEDTPILVNPECPHFQVIFQKSDVILHVLDARDHLSFRSSQIVWSPRNPNDSFLF